MKRLFLVSAVGLLVGCGSHFAAWQGRPLSDIALRWGPPAQVIPITDSRSAYAFRPSDDCTVRVTTDHGVVQSVEPIGKCDSEAVRRKTPAPVSAN